MKIVQVNAGQRTPLKVGSRDTVTGIYKTAVPGDVEVTTTGLKEDAICDGRHHGGADQALYLYSQEDYDFWTRQLGDTVAPGAFGENLTTADIDLNALAVGDVLRSPRLCLQVTSPRVPCNTLASRMGDRRFVEKFMQAGRPGVYCRVLDAGPVAAGDAFVLEPWTGDRLNITAMLQDMARNLDADTLQRYLSAPVHARGRADFERQLARLKT